MKRKEGEDLGREVFFNTFRGMPVGRCQVREAGFRDGRDEQDFDQRGGEQEQDDTCWQVEEKKEDGSCWQVEEEVEQKEEEDLRDRLIRRGKRLSGEALEEQQQQQQQQQHQERMFDPRELPDLRNKLSRSRSTEPVVNFEVFEEEEEESHDYAHYHTEIRKELFEDRRFSNHYKDVDNPDFRPRHKKKSMWPRQN